MSNKKLLALSNAVLYCPDMQLRDYLHSSGMSPRQFAEEIGVTGEAVRLYLHGERMPRRTTLKRIYEVTEGQVTANDFFEVA